MIACIGVSRATRRGCNPAKLSICCLMSGLALARYHRSPSALTAIEDRVLAVARIEPRRSLEQFRQFTIPLRKTAARRRSQDLNAHTGLTSLAGVSLQRLGAS